MKRIFILLLFCQSLHATIPTMEGLFRNNNNKDISGNLSVMKFSYSDEKGNNGDERFFKFIVGERGRGKIALIQIEYSSKEMLDSQILKVNFVSNLSTKLKNDPNMKRAVVYGVLVNKMTNFWQPLSVILKRLNSNFRENTDLINKDKKDLLERYKNYLVGAS